MTTDTHPFSPFGLSDAVLEALNRKGFTEPSSIQAIALPRLLADEGHLIVKARTGTGKTAAFGIPLVERLTASGHAPRSLILTPTRELALQISREIASLTTGLFPRITAVYGGASVRSQIMDLKRGTEIVVGTPGRVMDLLERKILDLSAIDWFILDEADEMLDMGFLEDVELILKAVKPERRVALFSATMPEAILRIVRKHIGEVDILEDTAPEDEKPAVDQYYLIIKKEDRLETLRRLIDAADEFYGLIFCATKVSTDELARRLVENGYTAEAIHGDLSQEARERTLRRFRSRLTTILVATDVSARGLDIERLTHVINWDLPNDRETYVHRIGRTGRAGRRGKAISMALPAERFRMSQLSRSMERTLGSAIQWMKVPQIKSVMKAIRRRIVTSVADVLPPLEEALLGQADEAQRVLVPQEASPNEAAPETIAASPDTQLPDALVQDIPAAELSPFLTQVSRELIEKLGAERAVEALIAKSYGDLLDPSRYGPVTEFQEAPARDEARGRASGRVSGRPGRGGGFERERHAESAPTRSAQFTPPHRKSGGASRGADYTAESGGTRVYVGLGRKHGASAKDVAELLARAAGIPGRLVNSIEMRDYCAFATLPEDAAPRAYSFSQRSRDNPVIRSAAPERR
ncbi:MAG: DEAD/DEAH box helicase [Treponema sp.]|jgi:ATP-dependent RNA helicase DeaD|nr:DEAD/DEAH box helicase [Treponema sp.]